jgi:starvation-inducible DNA-binding protein
MNHSSLVDTGMHLENRKQVADGLSHFLADSYTMYLKTQNFHWNVTGSSFVQLHQMFEAQYKDFAEAVDLIAERIRALGFPAPASYREFNELKSIPEADGVPPAKTMILQLMEGHESLVKFARKLFRLSENADDDATCDLLTKRIQHHEKTAWMLRSLLEELVFDSVAQVA